MFDVLSLAFCAPCPKLKVLRTVLVILSFVSLSHPAEASVALADSLRHTSSIAVGDSLGVTTDTCGVADTAATVRQACAKVRYKNDTRLDRVVYTCAPLILNGLIMRSESKRFRGLRNDYIPRFDRRLDNYTQYLPAAVMLGLKLGGVKGRSSWGRMLASHAMSVALMAGIVNALKYSAQVERPDGTDLRSFPSGHTATAFMTATMLNKEYGYRSPWIGIGAYSVAAATGLMRMANNKHWLSDVMTGAGVGIVATEMGYYLTDLIFKQRGLNKATTEETFEEKYHPSFIGLNFLINEPLGKYPDGKGSHVKVSRGCTSAVEGAYFFNPYVGVGGRFSVTRTSVIVDGVKAEDNVFDTWKVGGGAYFSYPLTSRWLLGSKLLASSVFYPNIQLTDELIDSRHGMGLGTGLSVMFRARQHYSVRFLVDYNLLPYRALGKHTCFHSLELGSSFVVSF